MRVLHGLSEFKPSHRHAVVILGFFDGLHLGHQALIRQARRLADLNSPPKKVLLYTFDRHPLEIVDPARAPKLLTPLEEKIALLHEFPVDFLLVGKFDRAIAKLSPAVFLKKIIQEKLRPAALVIGFNYRYGHQHKGNVATLLKQFSSADLPVTVVKPVRIKGEPVSSTRIRRVLLDGNAAEAKALLGRPYLVQGPVVKGEGRGTPMGIPTANMQIPPRKLLPRLGIYAGFARVDGKTYGSVLSIGKRPTFHDKNVTFEAHLLGFKGNLYGKKISVDLLKRRRDEEKFESVEALVKKMKEDLVWGRKFLSHLKHRT